MNNIHQDTDEAEHEETEYFRCVFRLIRRRKQYLQSLALSNPGDKSSEILNKQHAVVAEREHILRLEALLDKPKFFITGWEKQSTWDNLTDAGFEAILTATEQADTQPQAVTVEAVPVMPPWSVKKPARYASYTAPLHALLTAAYRDSKPCPTARDVVEAFRISKPPEIAKVFPDNFDYYDSKGDTKTADLDAIREAIRRLTNPR